MKKQIVTFKKKAKAKKTDRVYSKIRLEPHKLASLSTQSSPSSAYIQENKSDTEAVDFKSSADETVDEDEIKIPDESKEKPASPTVVSSIPSLPEPIQENVKQESKFEKSFDEVCKTDEVRDFKTLNVPCISESCIEIKIKLNFCFHTSLWCLKNLT